MREQLQNLVNPIFRTALRLRNQWMMGVGPPFDAGRELLVQEFRELLQIFPVPTAQRAGNGGAGQIDLLGGAPEAAPAETYLGVGYALVCWADELFTLNSPVAGPWNERKFEVEFYATNDRAWQFWRQARLAADRPTDDDLEVFYLCVVLGFRGEWIEDSTQLRAWLGATRERLVKSIRKDWLGPPALEFPTRVAPRYGKARLGRMAMAAGLALLLAVPSAALLIARQLAK